MSTQISAVADSDRKIAPLPRTLSLALIVIAVAQLMVVLDGTIVNIALPSIQRALKFSPTDLEWVINAYALTFGGLLLLGGRAGDLFGRRRMFVAGIMLFTLGSLAGGFAASGTWLITARGAQGIGAAVIAPTALSLIADTFREGPDRNRALGVYGAVAGAGGALGLLLGGVLTSFATWRWVLFVNVPIGIVLAIAAPIPCAARAMISHAELTARPPAREPSVNTTIPMKNMRRRPKRSPVRPPRSSKPPNVSE